MKYRIFLIAIIPLILLGGGMLFFLNPNETDTPSNTPLKLAMGKPVITNFSQNSDQEGRESNGGLVLSSLEGAEANYDDEAAYGVIDDLRSIHVTMCYAPAVKVTDGWILHYYYYADYVESPKLSVHYRGEDSMVLASGRDWAVAIVNQREEK